MPQRVGLTKIVTIITVEDQAENLLASVHKIVNSCHIICICNKYFMPIIAISLGICAKFVMEHASELHGRQL